MALCSVLNGLIAMGPSVCDAQRNNAANGQQCNAETHSTFYRKAVSLCSAKAVDRNALLVTAADKALIRRDA